MENVHNSNPRSVSCDVSNPRQRKPTKKQSSQKFVSDPNLAINSPSPQFFKLPPLPKFHNKNTIWIYGTGRMVPGEKFDPWGDFPWKKPIGCSQLHRIGLPEIFGLKMVEKLSHVQSGILSFLGSVFRPMGLFSKRRMFEYSGRVKWREITFYTPEVSQHSPLKATNTQKAKDPLPSIMFWLGLCLIIFGGSLTIG